MAGGEKNSEMTAGQEDRLDKLEATVAHQGEEFGRVCAQVGDLTNGFTELNATIKERILQEQKLEKKNSELLDGKLRHLHTGLDRLEASVRVIGSNLEEHRKYDSQSHNDLHNKREAGLAGVRDDLKEITKQVYVDLRAHEALPHPKPGEKDGSITVTQTQGNEQKAEQKVRVESSGPWYLKFVGPLACAAGGGLLTWLIQNWGVWN